MWRRIGAQGDEIPAALEASEHLIGFRPRREQGCARLAANPKSIHGGFQINSRILPSAMLRAICPASGVPRARASTRFLVCSNVVFGGSGGSFGSSVASLRAG